MSGLIALLDDVAALAKLAATTIDDASAMAVKAGSKTAGVLIDDAAVTPRYVTGLAAKRELPIIWRITKGSLFNKLVILLPAALLLSEFLPWLITPLLMLGGLFLCFEGYEKVHEMISPPKEESATEEAAARVMTAEALEDNRVSGAIRTDFILSAEIMTIALSQVTAPDVVTKAIVLAIVAIGVTVAVYGSVALILKADDFGVYLARTRKGFLSNVGEAIAKGMPGFLKLLSFVGTMAMLWVGGDILIHGLAALGYPEIEHAIYAFASAVGGALAGLGGLLTWVLKATASGILGLIAGGIVALILSPFLPGHGHQAH